MPLSDDLLRPFPGDNPSGIDLYATDVLDRLKEAWREDDQLLATRYRGPDEPVKKPDYREVVKLATASLTEQSKDLRVASLLVASIFRLEGLAVLAPSLEFLHALQERFWSTLYPQLGDDPDDIAQRSREIEFAAKQFCLHLAEIPITQSGLTIGKYKESQAVGYESDADTAELKKARSMAISASKLTAEEFDRSFKETPKTYYVEALANLNLALEKIKLLEKYQQQAYGEKNSPRVSELLTAISSLEEVMKKWLDEKGKTEPNPGPTMDAIVHASDNATPVVSPPNEISEAGTNAAEIPAEQFETRAFADSRASVPEKLPLVGFGPLEGIQDAHAHIVQSALFLLEETPHSPAPYVVCAGVRLSETRLQGPSPESGFAVGPPPQARLSLRELCKVGDWPALLRAALPLLVEPCGRAWLDLHHYIWMAAEQSGRDAMAAAVCSTLRALLTKRPEVRVWLLEDGTSAANPETQEWLYSQGIAPRLQTFEPQLFVVSSGNATEQESVPQSAYDTALAMVREGRPLDGISIMAREAASQSNGRMRFHRRLQLAEICISARNLLVAQPLLEDLVAEIERRRLETWECGELLGTPIALLLQCLIGTPEAESKRAALFQRLCLLDPKAASDASTRT